MQFFLLPLPDKLPLHPIHSFFPASHTVSAYNIVGAPCISVKQMNADS